MSPPRIPYHGPVVPGAQDRDNFVRNLITVLYPYGAAAWAVDPPVSGHSLSTSIAALPPVLTLDEIKLHCHIEIDQTIDDPLLLGMEMAARLHTQRQLRMDFDAGVGENVKQAMYFLIAHWYRNREAVIVGTVSTALPLGYLAVLFPERDYSEVY
jgi:hypothetical protein